MFYASAFPEPILQVRVGEEPLLEEKKSITSCSKGHNFSKV